LGSDYKLLRNGVFLMAKATPKKFAMQQCFEILLRRPSDKKILAYLTDCKTSSLENTVEMV